MAKIKWKVGERPTGRFRSFVAREWPSGYVGEEIVAMLKPVIPGLSYHVNISETTLIIPRVCDRREFKWQWRTLVGRPMGVTQAKALIAKFYEKNPEWLPKE